MQHILSYAYKYLDAGLSVIPSNKCRQKHYRSMPFSTWLLQKGAVKRNDQVEREGNRDTAA